MSTKNNQKRPDYTLEFKQDAAKLVNEKGYPHQQAADSLGVSLSAIGRWVRAERGTVPAATVKKTVLPLSDQAELVRYSVQSQVFGSSHPRELPPQVLTEPGTFECLYISNWIRDF